MLGLNPEVISYFTPSFEYADGRLSFKYGDRAAECWAPGFHRQLVTSECWLAGARHPNLVTDLYIGHSAAELLCFASLRYFNLPKNPEQMAFAAVGLLPSAAQVNALKNAFPFAHWHLLFGPDLLGRIADVAIASWYKAYCAAFRVHDDRILVTYRGKSFAFGTGNFSLHRFERRTGLRAGIRTHKPPRGMDSFVELQLLNNDP